MARFFFDAHNVNDEPWDDDGTECCNREEIEAQARRVAMAASKSHCDMDPPVMVTVLNASQTVVMTARLKDDEVAYEWALPARGRGGRRKGAGNGQRAEG